jgi:hypothetical protein
LEVVDVKKEVFILAFLSMLAPLFAQSTAGLERWITDYPKGGNSFAGYRITRCTVERNGALLVIDRNGPSVAVEFDVMTPRIVNNNYTGDLFGVGFEFLAAFNVPYFLPDYAYDLFLNTFINR